MDEQQLTAAFAYEPLTCRRCGIALDSTSVRWLTASLDKERPASHADFNSFQGNHKDAQWDSYGECCAPLMTGERGELEHALGLELEISHHGAVRYPAMGAVSGIVHLTTLDNNQFPVVVASPVMDDIGLSIDRGAPYWALHAYRHHFSDRRLDLMQCVEAKDGLAMQVSFKVTKQGKLTCPRRTALTPNTASKLSLFGAI